RVLVLEVELRQLAARLELAEEDVREGRRDVEVLRERQIAQEGGDQRDVRPPEHREAGPEDLRRQVPEWDGQGVRDKGARDLTVRGDLADLREHFGRDDAADQ